MPAVREDAEHLRDGRGKPEVYILTNDLFKPRKFELMLPNPFTDWGKILLEKYMLWKNRRGYAHLP